MTEVLISSSVLIAAVALIRLLLRSRLSPRLRYALWLPVLLRLALPFSLFASPLSAAGAAEQAARAVVQAVETAEAIEPVEPAGTADADAPGTANPPQRSPAQILSLVWLIGSAVAGLWFLGVGLRLSARLRRSRTGFAADAPVPVYVSDGLSSPCLYGLFRPAVYLTERAAADAELAGIALTHELTHLRHRDNIWSAARVLCLIAYWFDPLVWLAVYLSRQDGELYCDADAVRALGEDRRYDYGRALLSLSEDAPRVSVLICSVSTMSGGAKRLRERIRAIAESSRISVPLSAAAAAAAILAAVCAFSGPADAAAAQPAQSPSFTPPPVTETSAPAAPSSPSPIPTTGRQLLPPVAGRSTPEPPTGQNTPVPTAAPTPAETGPATASPAPTAVPDTEEQAITPVPEETASAPAEEDLTHRFTIQAGEGGSIPAGMDAYINGSYRAGETISLVAREVPGYRFVMWSSSGGGAFSDAQSTGSSFTMPDNDVTVTALFEPLPETSDTSVLPIPAAPENEIPPETDPEAFEMPASTPPDEDASMSPSEPEAAAPASDPGGGQESGMTAEETDAELSPP